MENTAFCQSCAMPLMSVQEHSTNADGSRNQDYCRYCYENGAFTSNMTMEQMIDFCVPFVKEQYGNEEAARKVLEGWFPQLKRWKK